MSIADKLTYLNTTKQLLKTEINKINNVLDDNSTFRSYPEELFNGYLDILNNGTDTLWNNLEKVSQTGTEAVLEGVETAPMKMVLNGNTSQETTSGKNTLPYTEQTFNEEINGITFTGEKGVYTISGTPEGSSATSTQYSLIEEYTIKEGDYLHLLNNSASSVVAFALRFTDATSSTPALAPVNRIFNLSSYVGKTINKINLYCNAQYTGEKITLTPMILNNISTYTEFEKYTGGIPSPNPDYPQEVKVVKGENVVSVHGKNLFDIDTITKNKTIDLNTGEVDVDTNDRDTSDFILVTNSVTYSCNVTMTRIAFYDKSKNFISMKVIQPSVVTPDNCKYVRFSYDNSLSNIQFERGLSSEFTPNAKTYPISLGTLELCKIGDYKDYLFKRNGKWYVHKEIEKVVLDGSENFGVLTAWNYENTSVYHCGIQNVTNSSVLISNYFTYDANTYGKDINGIMQIVWGANVLFRINNSIAPTVEDFKTWLSTHNTIVYYILATPTEEEITNTTLIEQLEAIYKAKSVKDKTYITQTNDELPFILDVEAIKEYEVN